jgi:hypothetical protein
MLRIAINGHVISFDASFRQTGVSNHTLWLLRELARIDTVNQYTVFAGPRTTRERLGLPPHFQVKQSRFPTGMPEYRIPWEQIVAPVLLARDQYTLFHGTLNTAPLLSPVPLSSLFMISRLWMSPTAIERLIGSI